MATDISVDITLYKLQYVFIYAEDLLTVETDINNNFINQYLPLMGNILSSSNSIRQANSRSYMSLESFDMLTLHYKYHHQVTLPCSFQMVRALLPVHDKHRTEVPVSVSHPLLVTTRKNTKAASRSISPGHGKTHPQPSCPSGSTSQISKALKRTSDTGEYIQS